MTRLLPTLLLLACLQQPNPVWTSPFGGQTMPSTAAGTPTTTGGVADTTDTGGPSNLTTPPAPAVAVSGECYYLYTDVTAGSQQLRQAPPAGGSPTTLLDLMPPLEGITNNLVWFDGWWFACGSSDPFVIHPLTGATTELDQPCTGLLVLDGQLAMCTSGAGRWYDFYDTAAQAIAGTPVDNQFIDWDSNWSRVRILSCDGVATC